MINPILTLNLNENAIFFLNSVKKLRAFYREEEYKIKQKNLGEKENEEIEKISINLKTLKKITKLNLKLDEIVLPELIKCNILKWEKDNIINIEMINYYFDEIDTKKIEEDFLLTSQWLSWKTAQKIIETKDLTFNDKVQKIFNNIEWLKEKQNVLKDLIDEKLSEDEELQEMIQEFDALKNAIKIKKTWVLNESMNNSKDELKNDLKEEKDTLFDFLEFSIENWKIKEVEITNKKGQKLKPKIQFSLKPIKEKK